MKKQTKIRATVTFNCKGKSYRKTSWRYAEEVEYHTLLWCFPFVIPADSITDVKEW